MQQDGQYDAQDSFDLTQTADTIQPGLQTARHQLLDCLAAAIYTCDQNGFITFYNPAAAELWGREPELGKDLWCGSWKIWQPDGITPLSLDGCPMAIALKDGVSVRGVEIVVERPDGVRRHIMPHPDPVLDEHGRVTGAINMLVDITTLKEKENELRESQERFRKAALELEIKVEERTQELKEANEALLRTNAELEQFAFIASHDMQEPLRKIKAFSERLGNKLGPSVDEDARLYLDKIKNASDRMGTLINSILNYSRTSHQANQMEQTDLNEVLAQVLSDFEVRLEEQNTRVDVGTLPLLKAIPMQMNQLFYNLTSNSLKFCGEDSPCHLQISSRRLSAEEAGVHFPDSSQSYCEIVFKDNGIGFSPEFATNIFRIFERLHTRDQYEGTGIGLALCKKIVEMHSGQIFATSELQQGTAIHIILPL
ncbi:MAG: PAS domain S-box protein [Sphingobacteriales bacterium]|nr:MAG: PAS domain S-box protein [Sphingobacteriales bacterium]